MDVTTSFKIGAAVWDGDAKAAPRPVPTASFADFDRRAREGAELSVVFFGGSLTWSANASDPNRTGFRPLVAEWLRRKYPAARFRFHDAAELWGMKVSETQEALQKTLNAAHGKPLRCGMVVIGPAGENRACVWASLQITPRGCLVAVNGVRVNPRTKLRDGDTVYFFPAVAGG